MSSTSVPEGASAEGRALAGLDRAARSGNWRLMAALAVNLMVWAAASATAWQFVAG